MEASGVYEVGKEFLLLYIFVDDSLG